MKNVHLDAIELRLGDGAGAGEPGAAGQLAALRELRAAHEKLEITALAATIVAKSFGGSLLRGPTHVEQVIALKENELAAVRKIPAPVAPMNEDHPGSWGLPFDRWADVAAAMNAGRQDVVKKVTLAKSIGLNFIYFSYNSDYPPVLGDDVAPVPDPVAVVRDDGPYKLSAGGRAADERLDALRLGPNQSR